MTQRRGASENGLAEASPHYHGHRDRLRARFRDGGSEALSDYELLELVLFRALPRRDVKPLAKQLIAKFGSFAETIAASPQRLAEVEGLGDSTITDFKVVEAAARRLAYGAVARRTVLSSWSAVISSKKKLATLHFTSFVKEPERTAKRPFFSPAKLFAFKDRRYIDLYFDQGFYSSSAIQPWIEALLAELLPTEHRPISFKSLPFPTYLVSTDLARYQAKVWSQETYPERLSY